MPTSNAEELRLFFEMYCDWSRSFWTLRLGKMIISLLMNITMNQLGGASVIAIFHS